MSYLRNYRMPNREVTENATCNGYKIVTHKYGFVNEVLHIETKDGTIVFDAEPWNGLKWEEANKIMGINPND